MLSKKLVKKIREQPSRKLFSQNGKLVWWIENGKIIQAIISPKKKEIISTREYDLNGNLIKLRIGREREVTNQNQKK